MIAHSRPKASPREYLAQEQQAEFKSEYIDGEIVVMTGASRPHKRESSLLDIVDWEALVELPLI